MGNRVVTNVGIGDLIPDRHAAIGYPEDLCLVKGVLPSVLRKLNGNLVAVRGIPDATGWLITAQNVGGTFEVIDVSDDNPTEEAVVQYHSLPNQADPTANGNGPQYKNVGWVLRWVVTSKGTLTIGPT